MATLRPTTFHVDLALQFCANCDRIRAEQEKRLLGLKNEQDKLFEQIAVELSPQKYHGQMAATVERYS